jgi:sulfur relay (sulfurtransferase) DsrF/TusC family protein
MMRYKTEPRGLTATFKITKTYYVTCEGDTEEECWAMAESLDLAKLSEDDLEDVEVDILDGFEYASF